MSTVVYRDGVVAADTKAYGGKYRHSPGQKSKLHRLADGSIVAVTSSVVGLPERVVDYLATGGHPRDWVGELDGDVMMVRPDGSLYLAIGTAWLSGPIATDRHAIGSGSDFAYAAMEMGASASRAVEVACACDMHSGLPVETMLVGPVP
jgi:hypothetical protein